MIPEFPKFKNLEFTDKKNIESIASKYPPYSDFNFVSMWCWNTKEEVRVSKLNANLVVEFNDYITGEAFYSFIGGNQINDTISKLLDLSESDLGRSKLKLVPEISVLGVNKDIFSIEEDIGNYDYLYDVNLLSSCRGKSMETKRNLINRLIRHSPNIKSNQIDLLNLDTQKKIFELLDRWEQNKIDLNKPVEKKNEAIALKRLFSVIESINLVGIGVFDEGTLIGFSINEILLEPYAITHFAKSDSTFPGVYAFLMKETCSQILCYNRSVLNYEQDLGLSNLRFSKQSFRPINFFKKYVIYPKK